ncbi:U2 snRNP-associated SURP motif-containing protein [Arctopsyche grandis]|uniref:U2 snRNP-associated SURP motif-containing protein n=1 Tax=Arctopsyche grandis TaxID=121162 RepID=UPI00406D6C24
MKRAETRVGGAGGGGGGGGGFAVASAPPRPLSRRELDELKKRQEEEAAAHVFQEFVETFHEAPGSSFKTWVKAGTYDAGARKEDTTERGKLYKPQMRSDGLEKFSSADRVQEYARMLTSKVDQKPSKKKDKDKRKSNLELFKEELRQIQEEREERHKYKGALRGTISESAKSDDSASSNKDENVDPIDYGDPSTTNLYLGNLNPKVTTSQLMEIFGRFGPLASIKIMWPRSVEEIARGRNCGFVAYMSRRDGERALRHLNGKEVMQYEMKIGWGKAVVIPPHPIYIPPMMQQPAVPPPPSGLPFNAQPPAHLIPKIPCFRPGETLPVDSEERKALDKILTQSVVKVVIPTERNTLMLIHRMVEFVIREGPMFEAMIMNKEIDNPSFRFLFENQSPAHVYYRWKLFSLLQGDNQKQWCTRDFRMFKGGSVWRPPAINVYTQGMPEELIYEEEVKDTKGSLSKTQRDRLEDLIRHLTPERSKIGEAMVFCMEHAEAAEEISDCIAEALGIVSTAIPKKIARLYLVSDILHNCGIKLTNASHYRRAFETRLIQVMRDLYITRQNLESRLQTEGFRVRVNQVISAWDDWAVYPKEFLSKLNKAFSGIEVKDEELPSQMDAGDDDADGDDLDGDGEEGGPLDGAALLKAAQGLNRKSRASPIHHIPVSHINDDIDGIPMDDDIDGMPMFDDDDKLAQTITSMSQSVAPGFVPSRWESVEPDQIEAGAVTSQRWNNLNSSPQRLTPTGNHRFASHSPPSPENNDSNEVSDERRNLLRSVELKAVEYQDELEAGQRQIKAGWTVQQQVQHYRRKLIKKAEKEAKEKDEAVDSPGKVMDKKFQKDRERDRDSSRGGRSGSSDDDYISSTSKKSKRSRDASISPPPKKARHRSRSPVRSKSGRHNSSKHSVGSPSPPPRVRPSSPNSPLYHSRHTDSSRKHKHKHKY